MLTGATLALWLVLGAATLSSSTVVQLQKENFQVHLEMHSLALVGCKWLLILKNFLHFLN